MNKINTGGLLKKEKCQTIDNNYLKRFILPKPYLEKQKDQSNFSKWNNKNPFEENKIINLLPSKADISASWIKRMSEHPRDRLK